ncbi:MAG TPA: SseB family protein [Edaphocola sp.]|nr:SseB family protein [Edaphocola sp.]
MKFFKRKEQTDINRPVENNELKRAFQRFFADTNAKTMMSVLGLLKTAVFLVLIDISETEFGKNDEGRITSIDGGNVKLLKCLNEECNTYLPLFTDWEEAHLWMPHREKHIVGWIMTAHEAFVLVVKSAGWDGLVVNASSTKWIMNKEQINNFLSDFKN